MTDHESMIWRDSRGLHYADCMAEDCDWSSRHYRNIYDTHSAAESHRRDEALKVRR